MFSISQNLAKYTYGWSSFEQHHKIEIKKHWFGLMFFSNNYKLLLFFFFDKIWENFIL
jgi:hypothetical protein